MSKYRDQFYEITNKVSYEWKIENFFDREYSDGKLESPKFLFSGTNFSITIYPNGNTKDNVGWVSLFLNKESSRTGHRVEFTIRLKRHEESVLVSRHFNHLFPLQNVVFGDDKLIERLQLTSAEKNVSRPDGTLTVFCEVCEAVESLVEVETQTSLVDGYETLSNDFKKFYLSGGQTDVVIYVKGKKFSAHRSILSAQSSVFRSMFEDDMKERESGDVNITDCDPESFGSFLLFLYSGRFDVVSSDSALTLYATADKYNVQDLKEKCAEYLGRMLSVDSVCDVLRLASLHGEQELLKRATGFFCKNASKILRTLKYKTLSEDNPTLAQELFIKVADILIVPVLSGIRTGMIEHRDNFYETARKTTYEWKIENLLGRTSMRGTSLKSPKFLISDVPFFIDIYPNGEYVRNDGWVAIYLCKESSLTQLRVKYTLGLKHSESSDKYIDLLFPLKSEAYGIPKFIERAKLGSAVNKDDTLTVFCVVHEASILAVGDDDSKVEDDDSVVEAETQTSLMDNYETLSKNFEKIHVSRCQTDVVMDVRGEKFSAHRSILSARSSVFCAMFERDMKERKTGEVSIADCDPESFGSFLLYLYSGRLNVVSSDNALALYTTADKYNVQELKKECCECLGRDLNVSSVSDVLGLATLHEEQELLKSATDYFVKNANKILRTLKWQTLRAEKPNLAHELFIKVADILKDSAIKTLS